MKKRHFRGSLMLACVIGYTLLSPLAGQAQYHQFHIAWGSDCIMQDYRSPTLPWGIYDAIHENSVTSSDGGGGYFYGGFVHNPGVGTFVQYVCWPAYGGISPHAQQVPVFAGKNMVGYPAIGEGSSCAIKGYWPLFSTNLFTRTAVRYWQPADGTPHVGYQGMWMKEPLSGNWYHLGTFKYPFAVTGVQGMSGWQEYFGSFRGVWAVNHGNGYYHINGQWNRANQITYRSGAHARVVTGPDSFTPYNPTNAVLTSGYTVMTENVNNADPGLYPNNNPITLTVTNQPFAPPLDPIIVTDASACVYDSQVLVQWEMPLTSSPQLGYCVEVFTNASYTGSPAVSFVENEPETRQKLLSIPGVATPYVRLTISDIFFQTNAPVLLTPTAVPLSPATNVTGTVSGLAFSYYEGTDWTALPDFSSLTPVYQGALTFPDPTPRRRRSNYGFTYTGYLIAPSNGLYAFTLHSGDGSKLLIDGITVIDFDGVHDSTQFKGGSIALAAGRHAFNLQFFKGAPNPAASWIITDGLGLAWEGPGILHAEVPTSAYLRTPGSNEPTVTLPSLVNGAILGATNLALSASISANGNTINNVVYYLTDYYYYYAHPAEGVDYYAGQNSTAPYTVNTPVWAGTNAVRARVYYNASNILDSAVSGFVATNMPVAPWLMVGTEPQNYPTAGALQGDTLSLVGDNLNYLVLPVTGDCTLTAHVASQPSTVPAPDGQSADAYWRAGLTLVSSTNGVPGTTGGNIPFCQVFATPAAGTRFANNQMGNAGGLYTSGSQGGQKWLRLQRAGNYVTNFISYDGILWTVVNVYQEALGNSLYAGLFLYASPSMSACLNYATFDGVSLTGANVAAPASLSITPLASTVIKGHPGMFCAGVIGPEPASYQWQLNGTNLVGATNAFYYLQSAYSSDAGTYTVVANSLTSTPATLTVTIPAGSGVWTNSSGGSWNTAGNWSGGIIAEGADALADFSTLNMSANLTVSLNGAYTVGALLFDDLNASAHSWTLATGSGGPLTLAANSGTPIILNKNATNTISAVVAGTQGFSKTGEGYLQLTGASTITGLINVNSGTLEMASKSGNVPYIVAPGATLKLGYSTGGGAGMTIYGNGASDTTGLYLKGGQSYATGSGGAIQLLYAPTTIRQYGTGFASLTIYYIQDTGLFCAAAASGSRVDANIQMVNGGWGMTASTEAGANTATGDLVLNGPLNVGSMGFYKKGGGSLRLNAAALDGNAGLVVEGGTVLCGTNNCLGANAALTLGAGTTLALNGYSQTVASAALAATSTLRMNINKGGTPASTVLTVTGGNPLTYAGNLAMTVTGATLAAGDTFNLFSAPSYAGAFASLALPALPDGLAWDTSSLTNSGTISVVVPILLAWDANLGAAGAQDGSGTWEAGAANWWNNTNDVEWIDGSVAVFGVNTETNCTVTLASEVTPSGILFNPTGGGAYTLANGSITLVGSMFIIASNNAAINTVLKGVGALAKTGPGTLTLSEVNTYSGGTTINAGTLATANFTKLGTGAVMIGTNGTYAFSTSGGSQPPPFANAISGAGAFNVTGSSGNQSFWSGDWSGFSGTLTIGPAAGLWFFSTANTGSTAMKLNASGFLGLYGDESGITRTCHLGELGGSASSQLFGSSPDTGNAITLSVGALNTSSTFAGAMKNDWGNNENSTLSLTKVGTGTLTLSGANTYSGPTYVAGGTLVCSTALSLGRGALDISAGAKLQLDYTGTRVIEGLTFNSGTALTNGSYGSSASPATNTNDTYFSGTGMVTVQAANQTITFLALAAKTYGDAPFSLTATASSGLAVSYESSDTSVATVAGSTVTILKVGTTTFTASQAGNLKYNAASNVLQNLTVNKRPVRLSGTRIYDGTAAASVADLSITNTVGADVLTLAGSATLAGKDVGAQAVTNATGPATPARVQSATGSTGSSAATSFVVTLSDAPANGNTLVAVISTRGASGNQVSGITQAGATWTRANEAVNASGTTTEIWYAPNVSGAGTSITLNQASVISAAVVMEYSGLLTASPLDQTANATGSGTSAATGTTPPTTQASELWVGGIGIADGRRTLDAPYGNAFNLVASPKSGTGSGDAMIYALEKIVSATGAASSSGTISANEPWAGAVATFKTVSTNALFLGGAASTNYTLTGMSGTMTITPKPLTLAGTTVTNKIYDATVVATLTNGLLLAAEAPGTGTPSDNKPYTGDAVGVSLSGTFDTKDAGVGKTVTSTSSLTGAQAGNYSLTQPGSLTASITPKALAVTGAAIASKAYDGTTNATFSGGALLAAEAPGAGTTADDKPYTGDEVGLSLSGLFASKDTGVGIAVTSISSLTGAQAGNYTLTQPTGLTGEITARPLTVTASGQSKIFGEILTFGSGSTQFTSSGLQAGETIGTVTIACTGGGAGAAVSTYPITPSAATGGTFTPSNYDITYLPGTLTVNPAGQTINFGPLAARTYGDAPFGLTATASSLLPVSYESSDTSVATVSGSTVTILKVGTTTLTATQVGDGTYNEAAPVPQMLTVNQASQTITFGALPDKTYGDAPFSLTATASSGLQVSYTSSDTNVALVVSNLVTILQAGSTTITATQAGDVNRSAATPVPQSLTVNKADQTISFGALAAKTYGDAPFELTATATSGLEVSFASSDTNVALVVVSTVTIRKGGSTTLTATQAGNTNFNAASSVPQTLTVNKATPVLTWDAPAVITSGTALSSNQLNATSGGVAGTFVYMPPAGTVLPLGVGQTLSVHFTPADTESYNSPADKQVEITVTATFLAEDFEHEWVDNALARTTNNWTSSGLSDLSSITNPATGYGPLPDGVLFPLSYDHAVQRRVLRLDTLPETLWTPALDAGFVNTKVYVDSLVNFEVFAAEASADMLDTAKMVVFLKDSGSATNLVIFHGQKSGSEFEAPVFTEVASEVQAGTWYRLTVELASMDAENAAEAFRVLINGRAVTSGQAYGDDWKTRIFSTPCTPNGGSWFLSAARKPGASGASLQMIGRLFLRGTGLVDDLVVTYNEPLFLSVFTITQQLSGGGFADPPGTITVAAGGTTSIIYTADEWFRIAALSNDTTAVDAAVHARRYTNTFSEVTANHAVQASFQAATAEQAGLPATVDPVWAGTYYSTEAAAAADTSLATDYLLGLNPTNAYTIAFAISSVAVSGTNITVAVQLKNGVNPLDTTIRGTLKLQGKSALSAPSWSDIDATTILNADFGVDGKYTVPFTDSVYKFYKAVITP